MNLQSSINIDFKAFFKWWGKELAELTPESLRRLVAEDRPIILLVPEEQGFEVSILEHAGASEFRHRQWIGVNDKAVFAGLFAKFPELAKAECVLALKAEQGLSKLLTLPEAAAENLEQVVEFELDRYTPFTRDQVYFTVARLGKNEQGNVQALLVLAPRALLDEYCEQLAAWDASLARVVFQPLLQHDAELAASCNLLPERYRKPANRLALWTPWLLNGVLLILFLTALIVPVWREKAAVDFLKTQLKALEKETRFVEQKQQEINEMLNENKQLVDIRQDTPEILDILSELTHLFKDDSWVTNLQYSEKHLQIQGQSPSASAYIGILEASPIFSNVSFVSPLTQDKNTGLERFQISMDVHSRQQAEAAANSDTNKPDTNKP